MGIGLRHYLDCCVPFLGHNWRVEESRRKRYENKMKDWPATLLWFSSSVSSIPEVISMPPSPDASHVTLGVRPYNLESAGDSSEEDLCCGEVSCPIPQCTETVRIPDLLEHLTEHPHRFSPHHSSLCCLTFHSSRLQVAPKEDRNLQFCQQFYRMYKTLPKVDIVWSSEDEEEVEEQLPPRVISAHGLVFVALMTRSVAPYPLGRWRLTLLVSEDKWDFWYEVTFPNLPGNHPLRCFRAQALPMAGSIRGDDHDDPSGMLPLHQAIRFSDQLVPQPCDRRQRAVRLLVELKIFLPSSKKVYGVY